MKNKLMYILPLFWVASTALAGFDDEDGKENAAAAPLKAAQSSEGAQRTREDKAKAKMDQLMTLAAQLSTQNEILEAEVKRLRTQAGVDSRSHAGSVASYMTSASVMETPEFQKLLAEQIGPMMKEFKANAKLLKQKSELVATLEEQIEVKEAAIRDMQEVADRTQLEAEKATRAAKEAEAKAQQAQQVAEAAEERANKAVGSLELKETEIAEARAEADASKKAAETAKAEAREASDAAKAASALVSEKMHILGQYNSDLIHAKAAAVKALEAIPNSPFFNSKSFELIKTMLEPLSKADLGAPKALSLGKEVPAAQKRALAKMLFEQAELLNKEAAAEDEAAAAEA